MDENDYIKTRRIAVIFTIVVILLGAVAYFSTNVAERNNEMMYKLAYGENESITQTVTEPNVNQKTALV